MKENSSRVHNLKTIVAFTISILTVFSALLGWQMGNVSGEASGEYSAAQRAELNAQKIISINTLNVSENQRSFLTYKRYYDEYQLVSNQLRASENAATEEEAQLEDLRRKQLELRALYSSNLKLFPNKFITRQGTYDEQKQLGQMWASAARELDLDPKPHLLAGQALDKQVRNMQVALVLLALSLFFFAIVSTVESLKYGLLVSFVALGYAFSASGVAFGLMNWSNPPASPAAPAPPPAQPTPSPAAIPVVVLLPTNTLAPTLIPVTPTPQPQRYFTEEFDGTPQDWSTLYLNRRDGPFVTAEPQGEITFQAAQGGYLFDIPQDRTGVFALYDRFIYSDVRVDVSVENQARNDSSVSLICRYVEKEGWYEFTVVNNGLYKISFVTPGATGFLAYREIADGGSTRIKTGMATNEYGISCRGDVLALFINGEVVKEVTDHLSDSPSGHVGLSVASLNLAPVNVRLDWIKISKP